MNSLSHGEKAGVRGAATTLVLTVSWLALVAVVVVLKVATSRNSVEAA